MEQAERLTLASRAFSTDCLGPFAKYVTEYFGYDRVLPMVRTAKHKQKIECFVKYLYYDGSMPSPVFFWIPLAEDVAG